MQQLINLRSSINNLALLLIAMNKTVNSMIEVHLTPSESTAVDERLLEVLNRKMALQLDAVENALATFTDNIGGLVNDEENSDI